MIATATTVQPRKRKTGKILHNHNGKNHYSGALLLKTRPVIELSHDEFFALCQLNPDLRLEQTATGEVLVMPPVGWETGGRNMGIGSALYTWARRDKTGVACDSSTGYNLPNGATRSPDASWVRRTRLSGLTKEEREKFLPLCPDFVVELRSSSDRLKIIQDKMQEYIDNGALLGWLIDPIERKVHIYRPRQEAEILDNPITIRGDPELPGFLLELAEIWEIG